MSFKRYALRFKSIHCENDYSVLYYISEISISKMVIGQGQIITHDRPSMYSKQKYTVNPQNKAHKYKVKIDNQNHGIQVDSQEKK